MNELELIVSLFPIIFMLHEFEEIIGFRSWVVKDGLWIMKKFPKAAKQITLYERLSVPAFVLAVLEEFVLVGLCNRFGSNFAMVQCMDCCVHGIFTSYFNPYWSMDSC
jgi:hypothetical protein